MATYPTQSHVFTADDYSDSISAQSALSNVGPGDVAILSGVWPVHKLGPWHFGHPVHVQGYGYTLPAKTSDQWGSIFDNVDGGVNEPSVMIEASTSYDWSTCTISGVHFWNGSSDRYAIEVSNIYKPHIFDVNIKCSYNGKGGVQLRDGCFLSNLDRVSVDSFGHRGIDLHGGGSLYVISDCHTRSRNESADAGVHSEHAVDVHIIRGQHDCTNTGIRIVAPERVGVIDGTFHEVGDIGIEIIGGRDARIISPNFLLRDPYNVNTGIVLETDHAYIVDPRVYDWGDTSAVLVELKQASNNCLIKHHTRRLNHLINDLGKNNRIDSP